MDFLPSLINTVYNFVMWCLPSEFCDIFYLNNWTTELYFQSDIRATNSWDLSFSTMTSDHITIQQVYYGIYITAYTGGLRYLA